MNDLDLAIKSIWLDAIPIASRYPLPENLMRSVEFKTSVEHVHGLIMLDMYAMLYGQKERRTVPITRNVEYQVPATWWQAFKLSAIRDGNPFFNPAKVKYQKVVRTFAVNVSQERALVWPEMQLSFTPPKDWGAGVYIPLQTDVGNYKI